MAYKHIIAAYDGSKLSKLALEHALCEVKERPDTKLTVLHVYHFPEVFVGEMYFAARPEVQQMYYEAAEASVEEVRRVVGDVPGVTIELRQGSPVESILEVAQQLDCDLIVMGSRGLGSLKELMLGSVSHAVVQRSKMPVLIIKSEE